MAGCARIATEQTERLPNDTLPKTTYTGSRPVPDRAGLGAPCFGPLASGRALFNGNHRQGIEADGGFAVKKDESLDPMSLIESAMNAIDDYAFRCRDDIDPDDARAEVVKALLGLLYDERENIAAWLETQRNEIPATGREFAAALRSFGPNR